MSWKYKGANFYGDNADPVAGDSVTMVLETDAEEPEVKEFTYGYDGKQSKAKFIAMVRAETKAHLQHLNRASAGEDVTAVFAPEA